MERKHLEHRVRGTWVQCSQLLMSSLISETSLSLCLLICTGDRSRQLPGSSCHQLGHSEALRGGSGLWIIHRCGLTIEETHRLAPEILTPHFLLWSRDPQYLSEVDLRLCFLRGLGKNGMALELRSSQAAAVSLVLCMEGRSQPWQVAVTLCMSHRVLA